MHEDLSRRHDVAPSSDRAFGFVIAAALAVVAAAPLRHHLPVRWWAIDIAAPVAVIAAVFPRILRPANWLWTKIGLALNRVTSPVLMAVVYVVGIVPIGAVMRMAGRDPMRRARDASAASYWIARNPAPGDMRRQF